MEGESKLCTGAIEDGNAGIMGRIHNIRQELTMERLFTCRRSSAADTPDSPLSH
jgi:hypothetical protein